MTQDPPASKGYTDNDWDYYTVPYGQPGDDDYESDGWANVQCLIAKCAWAKEVGWRDYDNGPEGAYEKHWHQAHDPGRHASGSATHQA